MPAPHSPEFRERAVALARLGDKPIITLAQGWGSAALVCEIGWPRPTPIRKAEHRVG